MVPSFENIVTSPISTFKIGPESTPITLHNALVAHHSPTLDVLMNGAMSEAKANEAVVLDVEVKTFVNFSQWLYTSQYDMPYCDGYTQTLPTPESKSENELLPWDYGLSNRDKKYRQRQMQMDETWGNRVTQEMINDFSGVSTSAHCVHKQELWKVFVRPLDSALTAPPRKRSPSISVNWAEVLLSHARLYCFADIYGIIPLQWLCLGAVRAALVDFECEGDQVDTLVQLISYTVANTASPIAQDDPSLRAIVMDFAVIVFEILAKNQSFCELLRTNNDLSVELLGLLIKRLD